jgi:SAM-dependent methyltransferase
MLYDTIGKAYARQRIPDPRIAMAIHHALGNAGSVVNVGAGTGSYEPVDRPVIAIEPSLTMIRQRAVGAAPAIQAVAESLPLRGRCTSAATAFLTIHHWSDVDRGLQELGRIARDSVVILTWDPAGPEFWLTDEYFPGIAEWDRRNFPGIADISRVLGPVSTYAVPVPHDCADGFLGAHWRRPEAYLDPAIRSGSSGFSKLPGLDQGLAQLRSDLASGEWNRRFGHLLGKSFLDLGYRLVVARMQ